MILSHLILGFATSYIGYTPPSMLNITASKISVESNKKTAYQFIYGASLVVLLQVFIAIFISSLIDTNPEIILTIKKLAIIAFGILSILFIYKSISKKKEQKSIPIKNGFVFGISLSLVNLFSIPFFAITHSAFVMHGWAETGFSCISFFGIGSVLGTFAVLYSYVFLAQKFENKLILISKYANLIIGIIVGSVAIYSASNLYL